ncbi:MAG: hypothetical protein Q7O66_19780 [Dehalococcoidia bacterium]|nr:hypothetical protein [Dehalococcoidia bacterium]
MSEDQTVYFGPASCYAEIERLKVKVERLTWKDAGTIYAGIRRCRHCWQLEPTGHNGDCIATEEGKR